MKEFNDQGLALVDRVPVFKNENSWEAVELFFDLSPRQSNHLFYAPDYPNGESTTAVEVADRIESFLAEHAEAV
jgi:hypothetical protein